MAVVSAVVSGSKAGSVALCAWVAWPAAAGWMLPHHHLQRTRRYQTRKGPTSRARSAKFCVNKNRNQMTNQRFSVEANHTPSELGR